MTVLRTLTSLTLCGGLLMGLTGCPEEKGPMEKAGEKLDDAGEAIKEKAEDLTEEKGPMEKAGEKLDDAGETVKEKVDEATESMSDEK